jgi:hypothetical protein
MVAEPAGKELIDPPRGGGIAAAASSRARPGTLPCSGSGRSRGDGRDHAAMLRDLQHIAVLYPGQVLAGVMAQLTDSNSHMLMLPHM